MTGLRIVLAADEAAGQRTLRMLAGSGHSVVLVAAPTSTDGQSPLRKHAESLGIATVDAKQLGQPQFAHHLSSAEPDALLNIHSLTKVCGEVLNVFTVGAWNLHPGPLPEAAGINVPSWAVALGWQNYGVSLHQMTAEYDAGAISYEDRFAIRPDATGLSLSAECARRGLQLVRRLVDQLADDPDQVPRLPQDLTHRQYFGRGQPNDGVIDWSLEAQRIEAHVRAADFRPFPSPWAPPKTAIEGELFELIEVEVGEKTTSAPGHFRRIDGTVSVSASDRWVHVHQARKVTT